MMKFIVAAALLIAAALAPARALATCTPTSTGLRICVPNFNDDGDVWGADMNRAFTLISTATPAFNGVGNTWVSSQTFLAGMAITGNALFGSDWNIYWGDNTTGINGDGTRINTTVSNILGMSLTTTKLGIFTATPGTTLDDNGSFQWGTTAKSTGTTAGALTMASGAAVTLSGAAGYLIGASSITTTGGLFGAGLNIGSGVILGSASGLTLTAGLTLTNVGITLTGASGNIVSASSITTTGAFFGNSGSLTNVVYSTRAIPAGYTVTQSTFKDCITGSTVTITLPVAGFVIAGFSGSASNGTATNGMASMIEVDGGFPTGFSASNAPIECEATLSNAYCPLPITVGVPLAAGTHSFCASLKSTGGTNLISLSDVSIMYAVMVH